MSTRRNPGYPLNYGYNGFSIPIFPLVRTEMQFTIKLNDQGRIEQVPPEAEEVTGFRPDELAGKLYFSLSQQDDRAILDAFDECRKHPGTPARFSARLSTYWGSYVPSEGAFLYDPARVPPVECTISAPSLTEKLQALAPAQQQQQVQIAAELIKYGVEVRNAPALSLPVVGLTRAPALSEEDINRIAEATARKITENEGHSLKPREKEELRQKLKKIAWDLLVGIGSSAIYELLKYLAVAPIFHFASAGGDADSNERTRRLTQSMSPDSRDQLSRAVLPYVVVQTRYFREKEEQVAHLPEISAFAERLQAQSRNAIDPEQLSRSFVRQVFFSMVRNSEDGEQAHEGKARKKALSN